MQRSENLKLVMKKVSIIASLCSIQFYLAVQTIGQTEASYSSQSSSEQVVSAAIVFPKTIDQLETNAKSNAARANNLYDSIMNSTLDASDSELSNLLTKIMNEEHELNSELISLHTIQDQLHSYINQIHELPETERSSYDYAIKGEEVVNQLLIQVNETIDLQKIETIKSTIHNKLNEHAEKEKNSANDLQNDKVSDQNGTSDPSEDKSQIEESTSQNE